MASPGPPCASQPGGSGRLRDPRLARDRSMRGPAKRVYGLIIIIVPVVVPRSVAEMKPYAWGDVHGYAGTTVVSPIAYVVVLNVTTVVWPITYVVLRHAASSVVIPAASAALRSFRDS
jgi:hypothetical protein